MYARVCFKCEEYITLFETFKGKQLEVKFEAAHKEHPLMTVHENEVKHLKNMNAVYDK